MSSTVTSQEPDVNPYESHPDLSELESEVLWQYAKLAQNIKEVSNVLAFGFAIFFTLLLNL